MILFNVDWREEMLIFPEVKRAVSVLAQVTRWGYLIVFVLLPPLAALMGPWADFSVFLSRAEPFCEALLLFFLYLTVLWCHQVLLAGRGAFVTRWVLLLLSFFAVLHPVCTGYTVLTGKGLLVNQFLLPAVLNVALASCVVLNGGRMAAAPLRLRLRIWLFAAALLGRYVFGMTPLILPFDLLLVWSAWKPLRLLSGYAPLIVSLPPKA